MQQGLRSCWASVLEVKDILQRNVNGGRNHKTVSPQIIRSTEQEPRGTSQRSESQGRTKNLAEKEEGRAETIIGSE